MANQTDSSGLQSRVPGLSDFFDSFGDWVGFGWGAGQTYKPSPPQKQTVITVPSRPGYGNFSRDVYSFYGISLDSILSGSPYEGTRKSSLSRLGFDGSGSYFRKMEWFCDEKFGEKWTPVPVEFRLTKIEFADLEEDEGFTPRISKDVYVPILYQSGKGEPTHVFEKLTSAGKGFPLAHFNVSGLWVFKCTDGKQESKAFAIKVDNGFTRGRAHTPYDKEFAAAFDQVVAKYSVMKEKKEIDWFYVSRPYDRKFVVGSSEDEMRKWNGWVRSYLKVSPGDNGADVEVIE